MVKDMWVNLQTICLRDLEHIISPMALFIQANLRRVFFMGMGFIHSVTEQSLKDFLNLGNLYIRIRSSILSIYPFLN